MNLSKIHKFEQAVVSLLNNEGWQLEWCGGGFEHFDAIGVTPNNKEVIIEINLRKKYYKKKHREVLIEEQVVKSVAHKLKTTFEQARNEISDISGTFNGCYDKLKQLGQRDTK